MTGSVIYPPGRGSPPRVRGKERGEIHIFPLVRITPACAGKSVRALPYMHWWTGSPPRVRGKATHITRGEQSMRITPARAGKSSASRKTAGTFWDHPRVCGEKLFSSPMMASSLGSPPRVRGKVAWYLCRRLRRGITPACAGKSSFCAALSSWAGDHPRVCGEKHCGGACEWQHVGSPPRVRGKGT